MSKIKKNNFFNSIEIGGKIAPYHRQIETLKQK